ncbi:MAG: CBS domain-containing protein [Hydrogenophilaceae bacterium]|nr:CBS domain-containing protein [Hydrogenophilaceae bacterium]
MTIGAVCNREVVIAERSMDVPEAARLMRQYHVGTLIVVEDVEGQRRPVGIVTDRDIAIEVVAAGVSPDGLTVGDIMGAELATVRETEGVFDTIRYMHSRGVRRVPVVDNGGWLVGIVTLDDLFELLAEEINEMAGLISRGRLREAATRT